MSSPSPFGAFNGRRTCLLQLAQWHLKREWKAPGAFLTVVFQRYHPCDSFACAWRSRGRRSVFAGSIVANPRRACQIPVVCLKIDFWIRQFSRSQPAVQLVFCKSSLLSVTGKWRVCLTGKWQGLTGKWRDLTGKWWGWPGTGACQQSACITHVPTTFLACGNPKMWKNRKTDEIAKFRSRVSKHDRLWQACEWTPGHVLWVLCGHLPYK